jgi:hypothetical protein
VAAVECGTSPNVLDMDGNQPANFVSQGGHEVFGLGVLSGDVGRDCVTTRSDLVDT